MSQYVYIEGLANQFVIEGDMEKVVEYIKDEFKFMTGQEWYDRFKIEFSKDDSVSYNGDLLAVVRRAGGIE
jgi:hypothetical protein